MDIVVDAFSEIGRGRPEGSDDSVSEKRSKGERNHERGNKEIQGKEKEDGTAAKTDSRSTIAEISERRLGSSRRNVERNQARRRDDPRGRNNADRSKREDSKRINKR